LRRSRPGSEEIIIRSTGCPNGCARPYMAEIAFVGKAPGRYQVWLGGDVSGTRLNRVWKDVIKEADWKRIASGARALREGTQRRRTLRRLVRPRVFEGTIRNQLNFALPMTPEQISRPTPSCAPSRRWKSSAGPSRRRTAARLSRPISSLRSGDFASRHAGAAGHSRAVGGSRLQSSGDLPVHAEEVKKLLKLNIKAYMPKLTAAHYDAVFGGMPEPTPENEERIKAFSTAMKLEPFQRGMKELAPTVWLTALRKVQNPNRAGSTSSVRTKISIH
jgi:hypothetical protein